MTRSATIAITNPSNEPITIMPSVEVPESLKGVSSKSAQGSDYSAVSWLSTEASK